MWLKLNFFIDWIKILAHIHEYNTGHWRPFKRCYPSGSFLVWHGKRIISLVGNHLIEGVGQVQRKDGIYTFISEDGTKYYSGFEILCQVVPDIDYNFWHFLEK